MAGMDVYGHMWIRETRDALPGHEGSSRASEAGDAKDGKSTRSRGDLDVENGGNPRGQLAGGRVRMLGETTLQKASCGERGWFGPNQKNEQSRTAGNIRRKPDRGAGRKTHLPGEVYY